MASATRNGIPLYRLMDTKAAMRMRRLPYAKPPNRRRPVPRMAGRKGYATPGFAEQPLNPSEAEIDALNLVPDDLRGLDRYEARKRVVAADRGRGAGGHGPEPGVRHVRAEPRARRRRRCPRVLPYVEAKKIMQPHGDRSKVVIEPMLTDQWFVDTAKIVQPALDAVRDGADQHPARARREGLFPLAGEHRALVHLPPALVGAPDTGLVWAGIDDDVLRAIRL